MLFLCLGADRQVINRGTFPGDTAGDTPWIRSGKHNANYLELFSRSTAISNANAIGALALSSALTNSTAWQTALSVLASNANTVGALTLANVDTNSAAWRAQLLVNGPIRPQWYGAEADGATDDSVELTAAQTEDGVSLYAPKGRYALSSSVFLSKNNLTIKGDGDGTVFVSTGASPLFTGPASGRVANVLIDSVMLDGANTAAVGVYLDGDSISKVTFRNVTFTNFTSVGAHIYSVPDMVFEDCRFYEPANKNGRARGISFNEGSQNAVVRNCIFRYTLDGVSFNGGGSTNQVDVHTDAVVEGNTIDLGWYSLPAKSSNSGGTVSYNFTTLVDTAATFTGLSINADDTVRIMNSVAGGSATDIRANQFTLVGATFISSGVIPGYLVRCGTAFAIVKAVRSETQLEVEEWLDNTTRGPCDNPSNGTAVTVYKPYLGKVITVDSNTQITVLRWNDLAGDGFDPDNGTLYEVLYRRPDYPIHSEKGARNFRISDNNIKRGWSDSISMFGENNQIVNNRILRGQDTGITVHGADNIVANNRIEWLGFQGIFAQVTNSIISGNRISETMWVVTNNTAYGGSVALYSARSNVVSENFISAVGSKAWFGVTAYGTTDAQSSDNTITRNHIIGHALYSAIAQTTNAPNTFVYDNIVTKTVKAGAGGSVQGAVARAVTDAITLDAKDSLLLVNSDSGNINLTLPDAVDHINHRWRVINTGTNTVTVVGVCNGITNKVWQNQWDSFEIASDGTSWTFVGGFPQEIELKSSFSRPLISNQTSAHDGSVSGFGFVAADEPGIWVNGTLGFKMDDNGAHLYDGYSLIFGDDGDTVLSRNSAGVFNVLGSAGSYGRVIAGHATIRTNLNIPAGGAIELANNVSLHGRNAADNANVSLIKLNTSDEVSIAVDAGPTVIGGYLRLPNNTALYGRNAANSANIAIAMVDSADRVYIDSGAVGAHFGKNISIAGTTNQVIFGGTNTAPSSPGAPTKWISVQVTGEATVYRLPLYE
jgi:hypothetical protein